jgi:maleylacetate reductase
MAATADDKQSPHSPHVVFGPGAIEELPRIVDDFGFHNPLVVLGHGNTSLADRIKNLLGGRFSGSFNDAVAHVPAWQANLAVACAQEVHADGVIAVGGGSSAGYAKVIALALRLPWIAVPTTLSGAHMTTRYLVTTELGKESGWSSRAAVRAVVYDSGLLAAVPSPVLASSGMSAIGACLEVLAGASRDKARHDAERGLNLLWKTLPRLVNGRAHEDDRIESFQGAHLAGRALDAAGPGSAQLLAEELGAVHGSNHGALVACLAPKIGRNVGTLRNVGGPGKTPDLIREFAQSLGFSVELDQVCPIPDLATLIDRWAARPDLAGMVDVNILRSLLVAG